MEFQGLPRELTLAGSRRVSFNLPAGWTLESAYSMLESVEIEGFYPGEAQAYLAGSFERFLLTWELVRDLTGRCLEIGSRPYLMSVLLQEGTSLDLVLTNWDDTSPAGSEISQRVKYRRMDECDLSDHTFNYSVVDVENAPLPFGENSFDVVIFAEVIEHLTMDPVAALLEIKRVLKPGGRLILTTPNVACLENVARMAAGVNVYLPYSLHGPTGRHNREFTRHEIFKLLKFLGFDPDHHFTADVHPHQAHGFVDPNIIAPLVEHRLGDLGQYMFFTAVNESPAREGRPSAIFRSSDPLVQIDW